jgi:hypothetical protein
VGPRGADDELAGGDEGAGRPGRPRLGWLVGLVVLGGVLVVVRPDLSLHGDAPAEPPPPSSTPALNLPASIVSWDPRGDLAEDRRFVSDAVRRIRKDRPDIARVYLATTLPDGSRVALAGSDATTGDAATSVHALLQPPGVEMDDAFVGDVTTLTDVQQVVAWAFESVTGDVYVVALARPGPARFQVSPRVEYDDQGRPGRSWRTIRSSDGTLVVDVGSRTDPAVVVRTRGTDVEGTSLLVPVERGHPPHVVRVEGVGDAGYAGPATPLLVEGLTRSLSPLVDLTRATSRVLWSGAPWKQRRLALVLVTRPDGVRLQALVGAQDGSPFGAGIRALPPSEPDEVPWLLEPFTAQDPTFLLCPTGAGTLVYRRPGREIRLRVPPSGAVVVVEPGPSPPSARGADVTLLDPGGRRLLRTTLPRQGLDDPLALDAPP